MTAWLIIATSLLALGTDPECEVPPIIADEWPGDHTEWERNPDGSKEAITDLGHSLWWQGPDCEPYAVWGDRASNFVWMRGMREVHTFGRPVAGRLGRVAEALHHCVQRSRDVLEECGLLRDLLRTQMSKE